MSPLCFDGQADEPENEEERQLFEEMLGRVTVLVTSSIEPRILQRMTVLKLIQMPSSRYELLANTEPLVTSSLIFGNCN